MTAFPASARSAQIVQKFASSPLVRGVGPAIFLVWFAYLYLANQPSRTVSLFESAVTHHVLLAGMALVYGFYLLGRRRLPQRTPLDWFAGGLILAYAMSTVFSISPYISLQAALFPAAALVGFFAIHDFKALTPAFLMRTLVISGAVAAALGLLEVLFLYFDWRSLVVEVTGSAGSTGLLPPAFPRVGAFHSPNTHAMLLNLTLPFTLVLLVRPFHRLDRQLGALALSLGLASLFFSLSRGAWAATAVGATVVILGAFGVGPLRAFVAGVLSRFRWLVIIGVTTSVPLLAFAALQLFDSQPAWLFRATASARVETAGVGLEIYADRPAFGAGPYTYGLLYDAYGGDEPVHGTYAHNSYVAVLGELGTVGAVVILLAALSLAAMLIAALRSAQPPLRLPLAAAAAALTTLAVHGLVDYPNHGLSVLLTLAVVLALIMRLVVVSPPRLTSLSLASRLLVMALIPGLIGAWLFIDPNHARYQRSIDLLAEGRYSEAAVQATAAADAEPWAAAYQLNAGVTLALQDLSTASPRSDQPVFLDDAIAYLERGIEADPRSALGHANLAQALRLAEDQSGAVAAARLALANAPRDVTISVIAATVLEWAGLEDEAATTYARAVRADSILIQSTFWETSAARRQMRWAVIEEAGLSACDLGRTAVLFGNGLDDLDSLRKSCEVALLVSPSDAEDRAALALLLYATGREAEALELAQQAVGLSPGSANARTAFAVVLSSRASVGEVRSELLPHAYSGDADARALLALTYQIAADERFSFPYLRLLHDQAPVPPRLQGLLAATFTHPLFAAVGDRLGAAYYRIELLRNAPAPRYIPGEWQTLISPRQLVALAALEPPPVLQIADGQDSSR